MEYLGYLAGGLTTAAFVPQVWKSVRTRSVKDISVLMLVLFNAGVALWIVYGWMLDSPPVIVANVATLLLNVPLVVLKFADHEPALRHKVTKQSQ
jgi:MtN3 and saliva related transmembrane protein